MQGYFYYKEWNQSEYYWLEDLIGVKALSRPWPPKLIQSWTGIVDELNISSSRSGMPKHEHFFLLLGHVQQFRQPVVYLIYIDS
jgi:hypothetical protein